MIVIMPLECADVLRPFATAAVTDPGPPELSVLPPSMNFDTMSTSHCDPTQSYDNFGASLFEDEGKL